MNDDVEGFYTNSIPNQSRCTSFEVVVLAQESGALRYRFGIGYRGLVPNGSRMVAP